MKILIVGLGSIARKHIAALHEIGNFEIYALRSSTDATKIENVTNAFSLNEIEKIKFDYIIISNPTSQHAPSIKALSCFKAPLFIEKPIFETVSDKYQSLIKEIEREEIKTYVACNLRFLDCLKEIKQIIKNARINEVNIYAGSYLPDWRPGIDFRKNYSANKEMGGGVHIDLIHELDYLYWIFGEPVETYSKFSNQSSLEISAVDYANYLWKYKNFSANVILNYYRRDSKRTCEIVTDEATFLVDLLQNKILKNGIKIFSSNQKFIDTYKEQMNFFINEIMPNNNSNFNTAAEAYKILKLCLKN